jgi:TolA-binding protein
MDSVTREDLKRNELGEAIGEAIHYAEDHSKTILRALAALGILAVIVVGYVLWTSSRRSGANELLTKGMKAFDAEIVATGANPDDPVRPTFATEAARKARSLELFTQLDKRYGGSKVGRVAKLYLAQLAIADNDKARARTLWSDFLADEASGPMAAAAQVNLWKLDRAEGKAQAVADEVQKQLAGTERKLPEDVLLYELALSQTSLGKKDEAAATYRRIVDEHPQSPYFSTAQKEAGPAPKEG